jgi:hypothetical protein
MVLAVITGSNATCRPRQDHMWGKTLERLVLCYFKYRFTMPVCTLALEFTTNFMRPLFLALYGHVENHPYESFQPSERKGAP